jgi:hypothetical protein
MSAWLPIDNAPKDGTRFIARGRRYGQTFGGPREVPGKLYYIVRKTWFGKASHVPLYGWCHGRVEDVDLWYPTEWKPIASKEAQ